MKQYAVLLALAGCLSSCMLGPKTDLPETSFTDRYNEQKDLSVALTPIEINWWKQFEDDILDDLIAKALDRNFDLQLAKEKVNELRAQYRMESGALWPSLNVFGSALRLKKPQSVFGTPILGDPYQSLFVAGFDATWELDFFGKNRSARRAAYFDVLAQEEDVHSTQITVIAEVARYYINIRALQERMFVLELKIQAQKDVLSLANDLIKSGLTDEIVVSNETALLAQDESLLPQLHEQYQQAVYQLTYLLGKKPGEITAMIEQRRPVPQAEGRIPLGLPSDLLRQRPDIRSAEQKYYASCLRIGQAKADLFPSISLTGAWAGASDKVGNVFDKASQLWLVWPTINWNLFQGWQTLANINVKNSKQKQALITYEQAIAQALTDVEQALVAYVDENKTLIDLQKQVFYKQAICDLNDDLLIAGLKSKKEGLVAFIDYYTAQDSLFQSKQRFMSDLIAVYKALGGGWGTIAAESSTIQ